MERLPADLIATEDDRIAFLIANQGPDPFFFRVRTPHLRDCIRFGQEMHRSLISRQFAALRDGTQRLLPHDASTGRAFALGLLSHYVLDRNAHPYVYAQQWGIQKTDPTLADSGSKVHAVIEGDLDVLMLQRKRGGATTANYPPEGELVSNERVGKIAGVLMSHVAASTYGIPVGAGEYAGAVADMKLAYRLLEPAGSRIGSGGAARFIAFEGLFSDYSLLGALAHRVTTETPARAGNLSHITWENPFTGEPSTESFPEVFDRALDDYEQAAARFLAGDDMVEMTRRLNYSGRPLDESEICTEED